MPRHKQEIVWASLWGVLWVGSLVLFYFSPLAQSLDRGEPVLALLFGTDKAQDSQHSDTIPLAAFDPKTKNVDLLSIPRDTRVNLSGYRFHRINEVFGYHLRMSKNDDEASRGLVQAVEAVLSTNTIHVSIPFYVHLDYNGFRRIVDTLGGVWVNIPESMDYDDNSGDYHFHIKPGRYHFMGEEALTYVRFRGQSGDKGRIFRQQAFIRLVLKKFLSPDVAFRFPLLLSAVGQSVHTNMNFGNMICLALELCATRPSRVGFKLLPGTTSGAYWVMDREAERFVLQQLIGEVDHHTRMFETIRPLKNKITVNVWNASGQAGIAYQIAMKLRLADFDVIESGNYDMHQYSTRVIDRSGNLDAARKVAQFLQTEDLHSELNQNLLVDVEVVVGDDYHGPGSGTARPWTAL